MHLARLEKAATAKRRAGKRHLAQRAANKSKRDREFGKSLALASGFGMPSSKGTTLTARDRAITTLIHFKARGVTRGGRTARSVSRSGLPFCFVARRLLFACFGGGVPEWAAIVFVSSWFVVRLRFGWSVNTPAAIQPRATMPRSRGCWVPWRVRRMTRILARQMDVARSRSCLLAACMRGAAVDAVRFTSVTLSSSLPCSQWIHHWRSTASRRATRSGRRFTRSSSSRASASAATCGSS